MPKHHLVRLMRERIARLGNKAALRVQQDGQWRAIGWRTLGQAMDYCAQALIRADHQPTEMVGIYARNMPEWTQADLGILAARGVSVPIYPTSTLDQLRYIVKDAGIKVLFVGEQPQFDQALQLVESGEIRQLVALDGSVNLRGCPQASHFQTFLVSGNHQPSEQVLRERESQYRMDDLLTLIYTSGTTGEPKGVMLDFANIAACFEMHNSRLDLNEQDVSLCMLPLSHVFERAWSYYVLYCGAENVYIRDPQKVMDVIGEVQPTVMCAVPRLYEKAYAMIQARVAQAPRLRQALFGWATKVGKQMVATRQAGKTASLLLYGQLWLAERLVFRKLRARFGGRTRFLPVAGARLADEVNFFFQAMGLNLKYGYGMTETTATVCCYEDSQFKLGSIGTALCGIEVKLGENNELLVRSPTVMRGYYNKPEATAEVMTEDGFLRTGDAGELDGEGNIYFTERLKELMKTSNGKYVAPQLVEGTIGKDRFIEQIAIVADARHFVSALIVPCFESLEEYARSINLQYQCKTELLRHSKVVEFFEARIQDLQKELAKFEQVKKFTLLPSAFSMELGELTPTMKLRRKIIESKYQSEIEAMYNHV
ncbi:AMP-dependent synthetase/ligase [Aeromonas hydrophila]|uniref:AMP-dependent synthetase/ligase n=2 Tax=Aeromonas hydrophila TaxID=644 RepID=UPI000332AE2B|nr:long-chain fatty acid--CoA ligase [Aeromonas hydrophila]AGM42525.1 long-chain-fatty-acid--CoA ligase-like protein [Aeromonas hydrophila ML09-119]AHX31248.1 long-chain fatty acid--CoA ligase [Aeromonas hydrophila subsp. hydrophila AL09-71]AHX68043.1 long-chain fatty acid--CoA ligase [Aeromonas hydrophila pc104A]AJE37906.1 long-chain fatty acid--CoA ligase [Aeromonas hydrophila J-1]AKJ36203.1 long-chain fatty acid--CoA ligase [Aeromonas hydrophila NJ-35]